MSNNEARALEVLNTHDAAQRGWLVALAIAGVLLQFCPASVCSAQAGARSGSRGREAADTVARMDAARTCAARGDDECVVRVLEGWAGTQEGLELLIASYRALQQERSARPVMQTYVERFPDAPQAASYRAVLSSKSRSEHPPPTAAKATKGTSGSVPVEAKSLLDQATACLTRRDDECIVRVLEGKAHSVEELGLLIETYRVLEQEGRARLVMKTYVERFPNAHRAFAYRRILDSPGPPPPAAPEKPGSATVETKAPR